MNDIAMREEPLLGTAAWMLPGETADRHAFQEGDLWLGRNADEDRTPIGRNDDSHVLLCAKTRSGKGRALITNNLLLWPGSLFVNDPKGENASITAARRGRGSAHVTESLGQKVCVLDSHRTATLDDEYRAYYNPLAEIHPGDPDAESKAALIAESCVSSEKKNDVTWDNKAKTFIRALVLHIATDKLIPDDQRNLITLRRFIVAGDVFAVAYVKANADPAKLKANPPDGFVMLLQSMMENMEFGGVIADQATSLMESYRAQPKMWNSIRTSAEEHTDWIDDRRMREVLATGTYSNTFTADELQSRAGGLSVYVCLPSSLKEPFAAWPRILVNMILAAAQARGNEHPATGHQTLMMLDEFATMERMRRIETASADIAGAGVKMFFVVQTLVQLQDTYGTNWETFASAADTHIYYGFNDNTTAEYVSKRLGEVEVVRTTRSGSTALNESTATADMTGGSTAIGTSSTISDTLSKGSSSGESRGTSSGSSSGSTDSVGWGPSLFFRTLETTNQEARQRGRTYGDSRQSSYQKNRSRARTRAEGTTETETTQHSQTRTNTHGRTDTEGWQQGIHKKPLAAINELMQLFGTIEDEGELNYPGVGLVSTASGKPMLIQKSFYDRDRFYEGLFDPHPKYGFEALPNLPFRQRFIENQEQIYFYFNYETPLEEAKNGISFAANKVSGLIGFNNNGRFHDLNIALPFNCTIYPVGDPYYFEDLAPEYIAFKGFEIEASDPIPEHVISGIDAFCKGAARQYTAFSSAEDKLSQIVHAKPTALAFWRNSKPDETAAREAVEHQKSIMQAWQTKVRNEISGQVSR